jgi:hypothetical protein
MATEDLDRVPADCSDTHTTTIVLNVTPEERAEFRRTALRGIRFSLAPPSVPVMAEPPAASSAPFEMQNIMLESDFKYT